jgi:glycosyltransferase involved in cell wall biosynthesis
MRHACAKAKVILTDSRNSFRDITYYFPRWSDKVRVIYPAVDPDIYRELPKNDVLEFKKRMSLPDEFVLYTGALKPHKNPGALARLANELDIPIILATRDLEIYNNKLVPLIKDKHRISVVTITSDKQMALLYNAARLMIFPSFYEGFGLPPLEAMACGLPVICSGSSALPEVVGDAALLFSPRDYEDMVEKIKLCWRNLPLRDILRAKGKKRVLLFDWSKAAARIFEIFTGITTL